MLGEGLIDVGVDRACDNGTEEMDEKCSWNFEGDPIGVRGCIFGARPGDGGRGASGGGCRGDGGRPCWILRCRKAGVLPKPTERLVPNRCFPVTSLPLG